MVWPENMYLVFADLWVQYSAAEVAGAGWNDLWNFKTQAEKSCPPKWGRKNDGFESGLSTYSLQADAEPCWPWGVQIQYVCWIRSSRLATLAAALSPGDSPVLSQQPANQRPVCAVLVAGHVGDRPDWKGVFGQLAFSSAPSFVLLLHSQLARLQADVIPGPVKTHFGMSSSREVSGGRTSGKTSSFHAVPWEKQAWVLFLAQDRVQTTPASGIKDYLLCPGAILLHYTGSPSCSVDHWEVQVTGELNFICSKKHSQTLKTRALCICRQQSPQEWHSGKRTEQSSWR